MHNVCHVIDYFYTTINICRVSLMICCVFQNSSKSRLRNLESLNGFVSAATKELMWLNDKEEEEVNFDWSDRNSNMTAKKDNYSVGGPDAVPVQPIPYFIAVVPYICWL